MVAPRRSAARDESGETLLELLVATVIIGVAVVALLGAVATAVRVSGIHRQQALAGVQLHEFAEKLQAAVAESPTRYQSCATPANYGFVYIARDARYEAIVAEVRYWDGTTFTTTCGGDTGLQRVTLRVRSVDAAVVESLDVVIRRPCRPVDLFPLEAPCT